VVSNADIAQFFVIPAQRLVTSVFLCTICSMRIRSEASSCWFLFMFGYRYVRSMDAFVLEESWQLLCFAEQSLRSCFLFRGAHFQKFANMLAHVSSRNAQIIVSVQSSPNRV
jgi:hypothetical protein